MGRWAAGVRWPGASSGLVYATYSAQATTMKRSIGNAKVSIEPPKLHALVLAGSAITVFTPDPFLLFGSHRTGQYYRPVLQSVEQKPEQQRHQGQEIPDGGEGTQRGLEPLHHVGLSVRGRLFDERQGRDIPGPGEEHLQPDQRGQLDDQEDRVEADEHAGVPGAARLERQVEGRVDLSGDRPP